MEILVIEDDPVIGRALLQGFTEAGHHCHCISDGETGTTHEGRDREIENGAA